MFKLLFLLLAGYYLYTSLIKPHLPKIKKEGKKANEIRFEQKQRTAKTGKEEDYIDYEEVD